MNANLSHLYGCEELGGLGLRKHDHTSRTNFTNKSVTKSPNENTTYPLCAWWKNPHCDTIGKSRFSCVGGGDGLTHISPARADMSSVNTCSAFPVQMGRKPQQSAYYNEKRENYTIVSGFRTNGLCSAYPMISSQPKRTRSFAEISLAGSMLVV